MRTALAPAKINRELRVGALRPDGYHEIRSRFSSIDLSDRLTAESSLARMAFSCDEASIPKDEANLVVRAAQSLASRLGTATGARIRLEKRVPVGAGLGGGSADAAVTLRLLASLWEAELGAGDLLGLAASLGSDVPYFLTGGEADVSGRGERVEEKPDAPPVSLLVFAPPFGIPTREGYDAHRRRNGGRGSVPASLDIESSGRFFGPNDLEPAILEVRPEMKTLLEAARASAGEAAITGSGSAIVLYEPSPDAVRRLAGVALGARFYRVRTLSRAEYESCTAPSR